MAIRI